MSQQDPYQPAQNPYGPNAPYDPNASYDPDWYGPNFAGQGYGDPYAAQQYADPYGNASYDPYSQASGNYRNAWQPSSSYDQAIPTQTPYGTAQPYNGYPAPNVVPPNVRLNARPPDHPQSATVLVLALIGLIFFRPLCIVAWILGQKAHNEVLANPQRYSEPGSLQAGRVVGIIGTILFGIVTVAIFVFYVLGFSLS